MNAVTDQERAANLAYSLFRLVATWMSKQCVDVAPSYSRDDLLRDMQTNIVNFKRSASDEAAAEAR